MDDKRRDFTLYGKQGYGNARGLWQTIYLEGRGQTHLETVHFTPDIDKNNVKIDLSLSNEVKTDAEISVKIKTPNGDIVSKHPLSKNTQKGRFDIPILRKTAF